MFSAPTERASLFQPAYQTDAAIARIQQKSQRRVLWLFERCVVLSEESTERMLRWEHNGDFSLDAEFWVPAKDRADLERLPR